MQAFLVAPIYFWTPENPTIRTDVIKIDGKLLGSTSDSAQIQRPGPSALHHIEGHRNYSGVGKTVYKYEFEVDQKTYRAEFMTSWCFLSSCYQMTKMEIQSPEKITVYYDPKKPENNWLFPPPIVSDLEKFLIFLGIAIAISFSLTQYFHRKIKNGN